MKKIIIKQAKDNDIEEIKDVVKEAFIDQVRMNFLTNGNLQIR